MEPSEEQIKRLLKCQGQPMLLFLPCFYIVFLDCLDVKKDAMRRELCDSVLVGLIVAQRYAFFSQGVFLFSSKWKISNNLPLILFMGKF